MYTPQHIDKVIWKFAKSSKSISFDDLKEEIAVYSGLEKNDISDKVVIEIVSDTIASAIEEGLIKRHMFRDFIQQLCPAKWMESLYPSQEENKELTILRGLLNMIRFVQVRDGDIILIDLD